jgi:hypothetical protein
MALSHFKIGPELTSAEIRVLWRSLPEANA